MNRGTLLRLASSNVAALLALSALLSFSYYLFVYDASRAILLDFSVYYEAAERFRAGKNIYQHIYEKQARDGKIFSLYYFYPPFLAFFLSKFLWLSYDTLKLIWCGINYICTIAAAYGLTCLTNYFYLQKYEFKWRFVLILFFVLCFEPVYWGISEGQVDELILCLIVYFVICVTSGRQTMAGILLALAALIKMSPVFLLCVPIRFKKWGVVKSFVICCIGVALWLFISLPNYDVVKDFLLPFGPLFSGTLERQYVFNYAFDKALLGALGLDSYTWLKWCIKLALISLPLYFLVRLKKIEPLTELQSLGIFIAAMVILSPTLWFHHLAWLLLPLAICLAKPFEDQNMRYRHWTLCAALYVLLSQANLLHVMALKNCESLLPFTLLLPGFATLGIIFILLRSFYSLRA